MLYVISMRSSFLQHHEICILLRTASQIFVNTLSVTWRNCDNGFSNFIVNRSRSLNNERFFTNSWSNLNLYKAVITKKLSITLAAFIQLQQVQIAVQGIPAATHLHCFVVHPVFLHPQQVIVWNK